MPRLLGGCIQVIRADDSGIRQHMFCRMTRPKRCSGTYSRYTTDASGYELQHEVGRGATASVWAACAKACNEVVAVKLFHLDRLKGDKVMHDMTLLRYTTGSSPYFRWPSAKPCGRFEMGCMQGRAVQEVVTMRTLRHPHVLPVLAHFQVGLATLPLASATCTAQAHQRSVTKGSPVPLVHRMTGTSGWCCPL